jgi:hypothetical protein
VKVFGLSAVLSPAAAAFSKPRHWLLEQLLLLQQCLVAAAGWYSSSAVEEMGPALYPSISFALQFEQCRRGVNSSRSCARSVMVPASCVRDPTRCSSNAASAVGLYPLCMCVRARSCCVQCVVCSALYMCVFCRRVLGGAVQARGQLPAPAAQLLCLMLSTAVTSAIYCCMEVICCIGHDGACQHLFASAVDQMRQQSPGRLKLCNPLR